MNSETKILLPFTWPIVLRSEAKYNTQNLCCAVTTNSKEGRPDFELPCGVVRLSKFLIVCLFGFGSHPCPPPPLDAWEVLCSSSELVSVKYNSETTVWVMNLDPLAV